MIGDLRTEALHQALADTPIEDDTLLGLLILAFGCDDVSVDSGSDLRGDDREAICRALTEGGVLTTDLDLLRQAARRMLVGALSCRENRSQSGPFARIAGEAIGASLRLPNMATEEFLSCLSRGALETVARAEGVNIAPRAKDTRARMVQAQALARRATAPATLRAYKADWAHYAAWCARAGFVPVPAAPATVGAYLASPAESHAPTTIRRRLSAIGKMHRFNDLPWNSAHRDIQEPLRGLLRQHGRPPHKAAPLTLAMPRRLLATCDPSARGRRDRALLLFGFAGALRRSELVALRVDDVGLDAGGLRLRIARSKTDPTGQGAEIGLPRGKHAETCPAWFSMVAYLEDRYYATASRYTTSAFMRLKLGADLTERRLKPHVFESADEANRFASQGARESGEPVS